jgi:aspartate-semialdehyde dehydrogenase
MVSCRAASNTPTAAGDTQEPGVQRIAIVGATGAVGQEMIALLRQRHPAIEDVRLLASARSAGRTIAGVHGPATVQALTAEALRGVDIALFSAGAGVSREFAPLARDAGAIVIDNSSAFRMDPAVPLVVPEINPDALAAHRGIIANPNCSTIILVMALAPLRKLGRIERVVVSTYQAVSGAGARALAELDEQTRAVIAGATPQPGVFGEPCAFNVFSHDAAIDDAGENVEERKLRDESRKIFADPKLRIVATCLRVPVRRAHTESVAIEFDRAIDVDAARAALGASPGIRIVDDRAANRFPTPLAAADQDDVLVGRLRSDPSLADGRGLLLLCAGDQLRKGAALNAIQIAELLSERRES